MHPPVVILHPGRQGPLLLVSRDLSHSESPCVTRGCAHWPRTITRTATSFPQLLLLLPSPRLLCWPADGRACAALRSHVTAEERPAAALVLRRRRARSDSCQAARRAHKKTEDAAPSLGLSPQREGRKHRISARLLAHPRFLSGGKALHKCGRHLVKVVISVIDCSYCHLLRRRVVVVVVTYRGRKCSRVLKN